ncbi:MAG: ATP-binding cassette domain-containing protein [Bacteroidetes bacterium]|nr:ATP-binding cassette domain-containing protein [Bacteroidota bacterium]
MLYLTFPIVKRFQTGQQIEFNYFENQIKNRKNCEVLKIEPCYLYSIYGNNGMGKTTLMNIISSLTGYQGHIRKINNTIIIEAVSGRSVDKQHQSMIRANDFSFIFQDPHLINFYTLEENLKLVNPNFDYLVDIKKLKSEVNSLNLEEEYKNPILKKLDKFIYEKDNTPYYLSGGEKQLMSFIRAMIKPSNVIFADEPWASMDQYMKSFIESQFYNFIIDKDIFASIRNRNADLNNNKIVIVISHPVHHDVQISFGIQDNDWSKTIKVSSSIFDENKSNVLLTLERYKRRDEKYN